MTTHYPRARMLDIHEPRLATLKREPTTEEIDAVPGGVLEAVFDYGTARESRGAWDYGVTPSRRELDAEVDDARGALVIAMAKALNEKAAEVERLRGGQAAMNGWRGLAMQAMRYLTAEQITACRAAVGVCSRCHKPIADFAPPEQNGVTAGYYVAAAWRDYANPGEFHICDTCMWADPRYIATYSRPTPCAVAETLRAALAATETTEPDPTRESRPA